MWRLHLHFFRVLSRLVSKRIYAFMTNRDFFTRFKFTPHANLLHESRYEYTALYRTFLCTIFLSFQAGCAVEETRAESANANAELRFVWLTNPARRSAQSPPADKLNLQARLS